jgi:O-antigen/teichoic acid export membrane protein
MAVMIVPLAAVLAVFPVEVLTLWLHNAELAKPSAPLASLLILGTCLNGLMNIPFALHLAHGNTRIGLSINVGLVAVLVPTLVVGTLWYGAAGAAATWAIGNALYLAVGLPVTHRVLLGGGVAGWATKDVLPPVVSALVVVVIARWIAPAQMTRLDTLYALVLIWLLASVAAALAGSVTRRWSLQAIRPRSL